MAEQLYNDGDLAYTGNGENELVCTGVRYQETDGKKHSFEYIFRSTAEIDAEQEAAQKARDEADAAREAEAAKESTENNEEGDQ